MNNMETTVKVSVCVPVYGVEKYIEKCVRSLMEQTMKDGIEFVFVNDCTKDNSMNILNKVISEYPDRKNQIKIIDHECNRGLPSARNTAMKYAIGEYIVHCDSDDWVEPSMYEEMFNEAVKADADIVGCGFYKENGATSIVYIDNFNLKPIDALKRFLTMQTMHFNVWQRLVRRSLYRDFNIKFDERFNMGEDCYVNFLLHLNATKLSTVQSPLYHYRTSNQSSLVRSSGRKGEKELTLMMDEIERVLQNTQYVDELAIHFQTFCYLHKYWQTFFYAKDLDFTWYKNYRPNLNNKILNLKLPLQIKIMGLIGQSISPKRLKLALLWYKSVFGKIGKAKSVICN